ncbi:MAG: methyl-accepting chemotaxis protein [Burkholderiales bacterium]
MAISVASLKLPFFGRDGARGGAAATAAASAVAEQPAPSVAENAPPAAVQAPRSAVTGRLRTYGLLALLFLLLAAATVYWYNVQTREKSVQLSTAVEMQMLSQLIANSAQRAAAGNSQGFSGLTDGRDRFDADLKLLHSGGTKNGVTVPASTGDTAGKLSVLGTTWRGVEKNIDLILAQRSGLLALQKNTATINSAQSKLSGLAQELGVVADDQGEDVFAVTVAQQLYRDVGNFNFGNADQSLSTDKPNPRVALHLAGNARHFGAKLDALLGDNKTLGIPPLASPAARTVAEQLRAVFAPFATSVESIVKNMAQLSQAKQASREVYVAADRLLAQSRQVEKPYAAQAGSLRWQAWLAVVFGVIAVAFLLMVAKAVVDEARKRAVEQHDRALENETQNKRNQQAILNLLNDIGDLAEGDLRVRAQVSEDMTGAIADSINFTVDELRKVVGTINRSALEVTSATGQAQAISQQLMQATQRQAHEIQDSGTSVVQMATSIREVSSRASESAQVAELSLNAAAKGATAVQNTIAGMNEIREQIQQTAKRMKRLGESSQEIGEIVELISDITEQTNVLALNAAIQAKTAGDAGRGFSVVADEVQRLAQRSGDATRKIAAIVRTIQTDTSEAVSAMEQSTQGVIQGAKLSDAAGQALLEIETVSRSLAELSASISTSTHSQVDIANKVAAKMREILRITEQTTKGTQQTTVAIGQLANMAVELKTSVAGFRL